MSLSLLLRPESTRFDSEGLVIRATLNNHSANDVVFLSWHTPFDRYQLSCIKIHIDGRPIPYDGALVKRVAPVETDFLEIPAGSEISRDINLSEIFDVVGGESINISYAEEISYYVKQGQRGNSPYFHININEKISLQNIFNLKTRFTNGMLARRRMHNETTEIEEDEFEFSQNLIPPNLGLYLPPRIRGGNKSQKRDAAKSFLDAVAMLTNSAYRTGNFDFSRFRMWFGSNKRLEAYGKYAAMYSSVRGNPICPPRPGDIVLPRKYSYTLNLSCDQDVYAYTYHCSTEIWLCKLFWTAPRIGRDSKAGTLVHEISHTSASTDDIVYGARNARKLARDNPEKAILNADNYEYLAEDIGLGNSVF